MTTTIWSLSDLARELECSRQALWNRVSKGHVPAPRYFTIAGTPHWSDAQARSIIDNWVPMRAYRRP
jgi:hypothetical protein